MSGIDNIADTNKSVIGGKNKILDSIETIKLNKKQKIKINNMSVLAVCNFLKKEKGGIADLNLGDSFSTKKSFRILENSVEKDTLLVQFFDGKMSLRYINTKTFKENTYQKMIEINGGIKLKICGLDIKNTSNDQIRSHLLDFIKSDKNKHIKTLDKDVMKEFELFLRENIGEYINIQDNYIPQTKEELSFVLFPVGKMVYFNKSFNRVLKNMISDVEKTFDIKEDTDVKNIVGLPSYYLRYKKELEILNNCQNVGKISAVTKKKDYDKLTINFGGELLDFSSDDTFIYPI